MVSDRGFVFIKSDDGLGFFCHPSELQSATFELLKEGQSVEFEKGQGSNGPKAVNVRLIKKGRLRMIWKKKQTEAKATEAKPQKVKELSPGEIIGSQIEKLGPGQSLTYKLPEAFGGDFVIVELNPQYPGKGKKYVVSSDEIVEGKPAGKKVRMFDSDKPGDIAGWIMKRDGKLFS